jgi:hypothetical protein
MGTISMGQGLAVLLSLISKAWCRLVPIFIFSLYGRPEIRIVILRATA